MTPRLRGGLRRLARPLRQSRATLVVAILMFALTAGLCFLPGLGILNYYSSLVLGLVGGLLGGFAGVSAARGAVVRGEGPFREALWAGLWVAVPPPLLLLLNGLRVTNCDPLEGLAFYVVGAGLSILLAAQVGAFAALVGRRRRWAVPLLLAFWLGAVAWDLAHLYLHPAIFAYDPFVGFFSGAVYDTVVQIDERLLLYRLNNLAQLSVLWAFARLARGAEGWLTIEALRTAARRPWLVLTAAVVVAAVFFGLRGVIGYEVSRGDIEARLGGRLDSDRVTLFYDREVIPREEAERLLEDHLFRLDQLDAALGTRYARRIKSYVYGSTEQKRRLMGAANVYIAKPWLDEIHLNRVAYGAPVVHHELAHVVLGQFAPPPFEIPTAMCVLPHMALVEGAAEAFEWDTGELSPHQWSAAMRKAKLAPPLAALLGPDGFYLQPSNVAYTLTGSFIRWLLDTRGPERFERLYRDADFDAAYGQSVEALVAEWERWLEDVAVDDVAQALATQRFSGKGIFYRVCPLEVARLEHRAAGLVAAGDGAGAAEIYREVVGFVPNDPQKRLPLLRIAALAGDVADIEALHRDYLALDGRNAVLDAFAAELVADARWRAGDIAGAAAGYRAIAAAPQSEDRWRNVLVKLAVAEDPAREPILGPYLLSGGGPDEDALSYLAGALGDLPADPLTLYLLARRHGLAAHHGEAARLFQAALAALPADGQAPWIPFVRRESWRLLGHALYWERDLAGARAAFEQVVALTPHGGTRATYRDWIARTRWKAARDKN
ncbi:MAG: hypothetical protein EP329_11100 [Deltaproteobacteria bacterium]|nr:MAG: hypothetical protein EP329_11100 [Deltaproteobacteria bacterium]